MASIVKTIGKTIHFIVSLAVMCVGVPVFFSGHRIIGAALILSGFVLLHLPIKIKSTPPET